MPLAAPALVADHPEVHASGHGPQLQAAVPAGLPLDALLVVRVEHDVLVLEALGRLQEERLGHEPPKTWPSS